MIRICAPRAGLAPVVLPDGRTTTTPLLPLALAGRRLPLRANPPVLGEHTDLLLAELGYDVGPHIEALHTAGIVAPSVSS